MDRLLAYARFRMRFPAQVVGQQAGDFRADGCSIIEWNQYSAPICQQFPRVPVRGRDHGLSHAEAVGQRAGCHLALVEIRRDVHIAHRDEIEQRRLVDEAIQEYDMLFDAERAHSPERLSRYASP